MLVAIENIVSLNGGDAAILMGLLTELRAAFGANTDFVVFDDDAEVAARHFPGVRFHPPVSRFLRGPRLPAGLFGRDGAVRIRRNAERLLKAEFGRALRATRAGRPARSLLLGPRLAEGLDIYRRADLVVSSGGTYLVEHYDIEGRLLEYEKDMALGKPLILFTQSMGPFADPSNRARLGRVLDYAALTLLRDARSLEHARDIAGPAARLVQLADGAFTLAEPATLALAALPRGEMTPRRVAVSVREWRNFAGRSAQEGMAAYRAAIARATTVLVREFGSTVTFLSTCQGIPEYHFDDAAVATRIAGELPEDVRAAVEIDQGFHTPEGLLARLAAFDLVIATRMHMAILGLSAGVPVLPIAYEFKTAELFESLGQANWLTGIEAITPDDFEARLRAFVPSLDAVRATVFPRVGELGSSARSAAGLIREAFAARQPALAARGA